MGCSSTRENIESKMLTLKIRKAQIQKERWLRCKELSKFTGRIERRQPVKDFLVPKNKVPYHNQRLFLDDSKGQYRSLSSSESKRNIIQNNSNIKLKRKKAPNLNASFPPNQVTLGNNYNNNNNNANYQQNQYSNNVNQNHNNNNSVIPNNSNCIMNREYRQRRCLPQSNSVPNMLNNQCGHCNCCQMNTGAHNCCQMNTGHNCCQMNTAAHSCCQMNTAAHNCCYVVSLSNGNCNCNCNCGCPNSNNISNTCQPINNHQNCDCFTKPHNDNCPAPSGPNIVQGRVLIQPPQLPSAVNYYH